jgi:hypothetical protein
MRNAILLAAALACAILPAQNSSSAARTDPPWISVRRTECYGTCPVFTLRVFADGHVEYEGKRFVIRRGLVRARLGTDKLNRLRQAVTDANFAKLERDCCRCRTVTDSPWTYVEIADETGLKSIDHYHGCSSAPKALSELEEDIISMAGARKWIGSEAARNRQRWTRSSP